MGFNKASTAIALLLAAGASIAGEVNYDYTGHIKYRSLVTSYPSDSFFQDFTDDPAWDNNANLRLNGTAYKDAWSARVDYELLTIHGDTVSMLQNNPGLGLAPHLVPGDDRRLMDLSSVISESDGSITAHRLDRLYFDYANDRAFFRVGRQAISWGNGLIYNPMDLFNPFDPAAIDKEYKTGDDMLYGQYSLDSGDDLQAVWVGRRDLQGNVTSSVTSTSVKYHGFIGENEIDVLLARHYGDPTVGLGGIASAGGAIWRGDIVATDTETETFVSGVINFSNSWVFMHRNVSGAIEYYHNGPGISNGDYSPANLLDNPELVKRLVRGEIFTLGQDYLAASFTFEISPLWLFTPNIFTNLNDQSALLQLLSVHDIKQDLQLILSVSLPNGEAGTEFGGPESGVPGRPLSVGNSAFLQLAWYF